MKKNRAIICGYYGKGNGGDEALLVSLLQMLPEEIEPIVLSGSPKETQQRYGVESCDRSSAFSILKVLGNSDLFIWGGGSLIQDVTSIASPLYYIGLMALAQQRGLKTIAWAQGIGPLKYPWTQWMTREVLRGCSAISVRDRASAQLVQQWQLPFTIAPDPVWALEAKSVSGLWDTKAPRIAITLRSHPQLTPDRLSNLTRALVDFQKATDTYILIVPFQPVKDMAVARYITSELPTSASQIISFEDPRKLKGLFRGVDMAIGMRYHSLIMAAAESCRCFAISYDPKIAQLNLELDLPGWELEQIPDDSNTICQAWLEHYANAEPLSLTQIESLVDRALMHQEMLKKVYTK